MFKAISDEAKRMLWKHQSDALDFAINHLNIYDSPCLIRMPTGTGKTGVIACLTMLSNHGSALVLTPWAHLRDQMIEDLKQGFWEKVNLKPQTIEVTSMVRSNAEELLKSNSPQVIVATFAALNDLRVNSIELYKEFASRLTLVIVDEGHYEPAVEWGKSVKGLNTKTVLLTATPYRNDLKLFRITDPNTSSFHYKHESAIKNKIIRELDFAEMDSSTKITDLSREFAQKWEQMKNSNILPSPSPRAIICCSNANDIESTVIFLRSVGLDAIGVHEQFEGSSSPYLIKDVPDPQNCGSEIWVHQFKLIEGLDDNRFCCLALFTKIRNDRKLIQQIGRILRKGAGETTSKAMLLAPSEFSGENQWNSYLDCETDLNILNPQHYRDVVDELLNKQPKVEYFEGHFRKRFEPANLSIDPQVIISPSVLVRMAGNCFSLDSYIEDCTDTLNLEDATILGPDKYGPCQKRDDFALWVYASIHNSRSLQSTSMYEIKLETHCVVLTNGFVFIADTGGILPEKYLEEFTLSVPEEKLTRYIDSSFRPTHVSMDSSIPYDNVIRGAVLHGHDLLRVPASLTDRIQICRSVRASKKGAGRRYIGLNNARIRNEVNEDSRASFNLPTFVDWAKNLASIMDSRIGSNALFQRYMPTCEPPINPIPKVISIDFLNLNLNLTLQDGRECRLMGSSSDINTAIINDQNRFTCSFRFEGKDFTDKQISLRVEYQSEKKRFWFYKEQENRSSVLVGLENEETTRDKGLADFLNHNQEILLIGLAGGEIVYQGCNFYKIDYTYAEQSLLGLIERPQNAPRCTSEKGKPAEISSTRQTKASIFPDGSLFRLVADRMISLPFTDTLLICSDMGTECADFVAANFDQHQLALIHAKSGKGTKISASAFHDVVSQAIKNLVYLTAKSPSPQGAGSWKPGSKWNKTSIPRIYRTIDGLPSGKKLWEKIKSDIIGKSNPDLYVILLTTGCCDLAELSKAVNDLSKRTHETAQLMHLLDGLNGYARQLGVKVLIYDIPYEDAKNVIADPA